MTLSIFVSRFWRVRARLVMLTTAFLFALPAGAQSTPTASPDRYELSGTVVNAVTGEPIRRALVQMFAQGQREALTDPEGHFLFSGLPAGQTVVTAQKPGFFSEADVARENGNTSLAVSAIGPETPPVVVKLIPEGVITGRVTSDGEPVENLPIRLFAARIREGRRQWELAGNAVSDEEGEFRAASLTAGMYYIEAGPSLGMGGSPVGVKARETGYGHVFYPAAPEAGAGFTLVPGQHMVAEIAVKPEPWYRVRGIVNLPAGKRGVGVWMVDDYGQRMVGARMNQETGEFEIRAPAGVYSLEARAYGERDGGENGSASISVTVNGDVNGLRVSLGPPLAIPVRVKMEPTTSRGERALRQAERASAGGRVPVIIQMRRTGFSEASTGFVGQEGPGKTDTLAVRNLDPGTYSFEMSGNEPWYVQSAQCGETDLLRENLTVGAAVPCNSIDIVLRDDAASLSVTGSWEGSVTQATVLLIPVRAPRDVRSVQMTGGAGPIGGLQASQTVVAGNGEVASVEGSQELGTVSEAVALAANSATEFADLPPGEYSVLLLDHTEGLEYTNPEVMSPYMSKAGHVTLTANQKASVTVEMIHLEK